MQRRTRPVILLMVGFLLAAALVAYFRNYVPFAKQQAVERVRSLGLPELQVEPEVNFFDVKVVAEVGDCFEPLWINWQGQITYEGNPVQSRAALLAQVDQSRCHPVG